MVRRLEIRNSASNARPTAYFAIACSSDTPVTEIFMDPQIFLGGASVNLPP
jgi:hypothetical protein